MHPLHIDGFVRILEEEFGPPLGAEGLGHLRKVRDAGAHLNALIDGMLALGRVVRLELVMRRVDLTALATAVADALRGAEPARQVELQIDPDLRALGDETLLRAALENLLGNAWKFTSKGRPLAASRSHRGTRGTVMAS